jgi:hypothetical protein
VALKYESHPNAVPRIVKPPAYRRNVHVAHRG